MSAGLRAGTSNDGYLQVNGTDVLTAQSVINATPQPVIDSLATDESSEP